MPRIKDRVTVNNTYLPLDPEGYPSNLPQSLERETEQKLPIFIYEGWNIFPTQYGYSSFFGTSRQVGDDPLPINIDDVFVIRDAAGNNFVVALAEDGVYSQRGDGQSVLAAITGPGLTGASFGVL